MRITKFGHACVRIETGYKNDGEVVVIDPGMFTDPQAVDGATSVLITHEHGDHWSADHLRRTDAVIHTIAAVADQLPHDVRERTQIHAPGDSVPLTVPTTVIGEKHAIIYRDLPHFDNSGYLLDVEGTAVFHPGDALTVPEHHVDVLLLPVSAPWMKVSECIDYALAVGAPRNIGIHDAIYSQVALGMVSGHLQRFLEPQKQELTMLHVGEDLPGR